MISLRPYQSQALDDVRAAIRQGKRRIMVQIPTGGGKTLTAASMLAGALAKGRRSMFVAHRKELIDQTVATFARIGVTSIGVIRAQDKRRDPRQPIQVASIQTLARRTPPEAAIVFVDEAHRAAAKSYVEHVFHAYPNALILGLSATPSRPDGRPLGGALFEHMVQGPKYSTLIAEGHLAAPDVYGAPVLPDLSRVHTTGGDYDAEELEAAVNRRALIGNIVSEWQRRAGGRRTVAFAVSVAHSQAIMAQFLEAGVRAEHLDGETPEEERAAILARLASGETSVVSNVGVLCEGWDLPACKCLILARPTKSLVLYMQMGGRILRPWSPDCGPACATPCRAHPSVTPVILDHGGNVDRHGMPHEDREWSLTDKVKKGGTAPVKACGQCFAMVPASVKECPHCGYAFPVAVVSPEPPEALTVVELALRTLTGDDAQLAFFKQASERARKYGLRPGFAYHRFVERFGQPPPKEWTQALKRGFQKDDAWVGEVNARAVQEARQRGAEARS